VIVIEMEPLRKLTRVAVERSGSITYGTLTFVYDIEKQKCVPAPLRTRTGMKLVQSSPLG
jgi:hypothetical protein